VIQPANCVVDVGKLLNAMKAAGGLVRFARKARVDTSKVNMLLQGQIPNTGPLGRICEAIAPGFEPSELIFNATTRIETERRRGKLLSGRWPSEQKSDDAG
jgi:hypothetical protein